MKTLLIVSSDHHINSTLAICPPEINLDDGGTYHASRGQRWLWDCWRDAWDKIRPFAADKDRVVLALNGDLGELDTKRRSNQLISPNKATILEMVTETLKPALEVAKELYVIRGTAAHEGKSAWLEEAVANDITGVLPDKARGTASWWHLVGKLNGLAVDISHHASMTGTPWGKFAAPDALWSRVLWYYKVDKEIQPPDLVIRSHNHKFAPSEHVYFTPCWSLITENGYRIGRENDQPDIGLLAFEIEGRQVQAHRFLYPIPSNKRVWSVTL